MKLKWVEEKSGYGKYWHAELVLENLEATINADEMGDRRTEYYSWTLSEQPIDEGSRDIDDGQEATLADAKDAVQDAVEEFLEEREAERGGNPGHKIPKALERFIDDPDRPGGDGKLIPYAWPGGYPVTYITKSGESLCPKCAQSALEEFQETGEWPQNDPVEAGDVFYEGPPEFCADCNVEIESAYGDTDEEK